MRGRLIGHDFRLLHVVCVRTGGNGGRSKICQTVCRAVAEQRGFHLPESAFDVKLCRDKAGLAPTRRAERFWWVWESVWVSFLSTYSTPNDRDTHQRGRTRLRRPDPVCYTEEGEPEPKITIKRHHDGDDPRLLYPVDQGKAKVSICGVIFAVWVSAAPAGSPLRYCCSTRLSASGSVTVASTESMIPSIRIPMLYRYSPFTVMLGSLSE